MGDTFSGELGFLWLKEFGRYWRQTSELNTSRCMEELFRPSVLYPKISDNRATAGAGLLCFQWSLEAEVLQGLAQDW